MQENFLHFLSDTTCLLSINGKNIGTIDNSYKMELDILTKTDRVYVTYTPICEKINNIPYTFVLNTSDKVKCDNEYIKVVPFPNNNFDIIMKPFYYYEVTNSKILLNTMIGKFFVSIISDNATKITIYDNNNIVFNLSTTGLSSARAEIKKDIMIIEGVVSDSTYYLLILDTKNFEILHNDISNSIENNADNVITYKKLNDISNHAEVVKVEFENKKKDKYHVYDNNTPKTPLNNMLIPMAFLEAIKVSDDNLAKVYLANNHINTPINKFRSYFGEYSDVYLNRHQYIQDKLNYTLVNNKKNKNYNFVMENNKIKDIEEIF